jgi:hypothetical protein
MDLSVRLPLPSRKQAIAIAGAAALGVTEVVSAPVAVGLALLPLVWNVARPQQRAAIHAGVQVERPAIAPAVNGRATPPEAPASTPETC